MKSHSHYRQSPDSDFMFIWFLIYLMTLHYPHWLYSMRWLNMDFGMDAEGRSESYLKVLSRICLQ
jgi:hypothetical protein